MHLPCWLRAFTAASGLRPERFFLSSDAAPPDFSHHHSRHSIFLPTTSPWPMTFAAEQLQPYRKPEDYCWYPEAVGAGSVCVAAALAARAAQVE